MLVQVIMEVIFGTMTLEWKINSQPCGVGNNPRQRERQVQGHGVEKACHLRRTNRSFSENEQNSGKGAGPKMWGLAGMMEQWKAIERF